MKLFGGHYGERLKNYYFACHTVVGFFARRFYVVLTYVHLFYVIIYISALLSLHLAYSIKLVLCVYLGNLCIFQVQTEDLSIQLSLLSIALQSPLHIWCQPVMSLDSDFPYRGSAILESVI